MLIPGFVILFEMYFKCNINKCYLLDFATWGIPEIREERSGHKGREYAFKQCRKLCEVIYS